MTVAVIDRNDVVLRGRVSASAETTHAAQRGRAGDLPARGAPAEPRPGGARSTSLTCVTYDRALQRRVARLAAG